MKSLPRVIIVGIALSLAVFSPAKDDANSASLTPEQAYAPIEKMLGDKTAQPGKRLFEQLSVASIKFIEDYSREGQSAKLIGRLLNFGVSTLKSSSAEMRLEWYQRVQADVAAKLLDNATTDDAKTALIALDAAMFEGIFRNRRSNEVFRAWRERIDELTERANSDKFVRDREQGFVEVLYPIKSEATETHVRKLVESGGRYTKEWARGELKLIEVRKQPFEAKLTCVDGTVIDFHQLRGGFVYLMFWNSEAKALGEQRASLSEAEARLGKKNLIVITVLCEAGIDAAKAAEIVTQKKIKWPVFFDAGGDGGELAQKLNVTAKNLPAGFLFNREGFLIKANLQMKNVGGEVGKLIDGGSK